MKAAKIYELNYSEEKILGEQLFQISERKTRLSTSHRSIGLLFFIDHKGRPGKGSAILISKNLILTAAHNIYSFQQQKCFRHSYFKFYLSPSGEVEKYHDILEWRSPQQFQTCPIGQRFHYDYAIMKLQENQSQPIQYQNFCELLQTCEQCLIKDYQKWQLQIYGYPICKTVDKKGIRIKAYQLGLSREGRIINLDSKKKSITYSISTLPGQSGCPVIHEGNILAIHIGAGKQQFNIGRLITHDMISNLQIWQKQMDCKSFVINPNSICLKHLNIKNQSQRQFQGFTNKGAEDVLLSQAQIKKLQQILQIKRKGEQQYSLRKWQNCRELFLNSLKLERQVLGQKHVQTAQTLYWIGRTYRQQKNYNKAVEYYKERVNIYQINKVKDNSYADALYGLGYTYKQRLKNYKQARIWYEKALNIYEDIKDEDWIQKSAYNLVKCLDVLNERQIMNNLIDKYDLDPDKI